MSQHWEEAPSEWKCIRFFHRKEVAGPEPDRIIRLDLFQTLNLTSWRYFESTILCKLFELRNLPLTGIWLETEHNVLGLYPPSVQCALHPAWAFCSAYQLEGCRQGAQRARVSVDLISLWVDATNELVTLSRSQEKKLSRVRTRGRKKQEWARLEKPQNHTWGMV